MCEKKDCCEVDRAINNSWANSVREKKKGYQRERETFGCLREKLHIEKIMFDQCST